jgi:peptidoglycan/xylan/chitin deacetylase (PgdA/CDA1 family)
LREMRDAGMSIQSHTCSHPFLSELSEGRLRDELAGSKARIDDELGQDTGTLAYPGGDAPAHRWRNLLGECGYRAVATSLWGTNGGSSHGTMPFVRRCTISGRLSDESFLRVLRADPWLFWRQGARGFVLGTARRALGPTRYGRWRGAVLWKQNGEQQ